MPVVDLQGVPETKGEAVKKYQVIIPITLAKGRQFWVVEADSPEEAEEIVKNGGGEFVADDVEVHETDHRNAEVEELEDA